MAWAKRIVLFVLTNVLVLVTITIVMSVLGLQPYLTRYGIDYTALAVFCLLWGFGGAFISLAMSRMMAKWMTGLRILDPNSRDPGERWLLDTVRVLSERAGLPGMPEVGVYDSPEVNAFATGPTKARSLVAVSSGLLARMDRDQATGVLGHEIAHVANGDMVTMTLVQGVVNAFVLFFARIIAYAVSMNVREESRFMVHVFVTIAMEIVLSILGMIVVASFSRLREYRADSGGARLAGRDRMIGALRALQRSTELVEPEEHASLATLKISGKPKGWLALFATHPPLEQRIARLERGA